MTKHNQDGAVGGLAVALLLTIMLLISALGFGAWAYAQRSDYKNNVDAKVQVAVEAAKQQASAAKTKEFLEKDKSPLKTYNGPEAYGSVVIQYPKTWSGYVDANGTSGGALVDGYFSPGVVPSITGQTSVFALRVKVVRQPYAEIVKSFTSQLQAGKLTAAPYALPKLPKVIGTQLSGQLPSSSDQRVTTMVILPLRSDTLQIYTEGTQYLGDFNAHILPNFSFSP